MDKRKRVTGGFIDYMANKSTFIKLDRNIQDWRWYTNANTFRVFIHLLLNANIKPNDFENAKIKRGELATSYNSLANSLKLTNQQVRTAISHLKSTGEITITRYSKFIVISIVNYAQYQDKLTVNSTINQQSFNKHSTINQQQLKNNKNVKKEKKEEALSGNLPDGYQRHENSGELYKVVDGKMFNLNGDELNSEGFVKIDFKLSKSNMDF
jgi:hypothetical protein